ncbi:MAG: hypothetical protein ACTIDN_09895 [Acetobacter sp.]
MLEARALLLKRATPPARFVQKESDTQNTQNCEASRKEGFNILDHDA